MGLTEKGFDVKRLDELLDEINQEFKNVFGENFNTEPSTPQGQIIGLTATRYAELHEYAEQAYNSFNPDVASDTTLDNLVSLNGISRKPATKSKVELIFTGINGAKIPVGTMVSNGAEIKFVTTEFGTIENNSLTLQAEAVIAGSIFAAANSLTTIDNPITNVESVYNPSDCIMGEDIETDAQLRERRTKSFSIAGQSSKDSIMGAILIVADSVNILENDTQVDGYNNLPRNSFSAIVSGGSDEDVARAIFSKKPVGITSVGNTTVTVVDSQGYGNDINFIRPTEIDIYIRMTLQTNINYPLTAEEDIKEALATVQLDVGQDVVYSRLFTPINSVKGHEVISLEISKDGTNYVTNTIPISIYEVAKIKGENIEIN